MRLLCGAALLALGRLVSGLGPGGPPGEAVHLVARADDTSTLAPVVLAATNQSFNAGAATLFGVAADGTVTEVGSTGDGGRISALCQSPSGTLYIGGLFSRLGGRAASNIASFDTSSRSFSSLGSGLDGEVLAIYCNTSTVYVGGRFAGPVNAAAGTVYPGQVALWSTDSRAWSPATFALTGDVSAIWPAQDEKSLFLGGSFYYNVADPMASDNTTDPRTSTASFTSGAGTATGTSLSTVPGSSATGTTGAAGGTTTASGSSPSGGSSAGGAGGTATGTGGSGTSAGGGAGTSAGGGAGSSGGGATATGGAGGSGGSGGTATGTASTPGSTSRNTIGNSYSPVPLEGAGLDAGPSSSKTGFGDPTTIFCPSGSDGAGSSWLLADGTSGHFIVRLGSEVDASGVRLGNTFYQGRGTATFKITSIPSGECLPMIYRENPKDPNSKLNVCTNECPLSHASGVDYEDFLFPNGTKLSGIHLYITGWYGAGGGLHFLQLLSDDPLTGGGGEYDASCPAGASTVLAATSFAVEQRGYGVYEWVLQDEGTFGDGASTNVSDTTGFDSLARSILAGAKVNSITSVGEGDDTRVFMGGDFTYNSTTNVLEYAQGGPVVTPNGGLNGPVGSLVEQNGYLYAAGNFTSTTDGTVSNLAGVARWNYAASGTQWESMGTRPNATSPVRTLGVWDAGQGNQSVVALSNGGSGVAVFTPPSSWSNFQAAEFAGDMTAYGSAPASSPSGGTMYLAGNVRSAVAQFAARHRLAAGLVILACIAMGLGVVLLLLLIGLVIALARRKDEPEQEQIHDRRESIASEHSPSGLLATVGAATAVLLDTKHEKSRQTREDEALAAAAAEDPFADTGGEYEADSQTRARYSFTAEHPGELSISSGEDLLVVEAGDPNWWLVSNMEGKRGLIPASYLV